VTTEPARKLLDDLRIELRLDLIIGAKLIGDAISALAS
jgi:hypothetical protein